jgi:hypothetical protein
MTVSIKTWAAVIILTENRVFKSKRNFRVATFTKTLRLFSSLTIEEYLSLSKKSDDFISFIFRIYSKATSLHLHYVIRLDLLNIYPEYM